MSPIGSNVLIQRLLLAEEDADKIVKRAREARLKKLKDANEAAEEELKVFRNKETDNFEQNVKSRFVINDLFTVDNTINNEDYLEKLKIDVNVNLERAVKFLVYTTISTELHQ